MPYRRWDPFQDLISLHQELFGEGGQLGLQEAGRSAWTPSVDVYETDGTFVIKAEVPGVAPDKIKVEYRDRKLFITGQRPAQDRESVERYHHVERSYGPFERVFDISPDICCDEIEANYQDGIIEIIVPKKPEARPKNIEVKG
jgi:HSP20 family protein